MGHAGGEFSSSICPQGARGACTSAGVLSPLVLSWDFLPASGSQFLGAHCAPLTSQRAATYQEDLSFQGKESKEMGR